MEKKQNEKKEKTKKGKEDEKNILLANSFLHRDQQ